MVRRAFLATLIALVAMTALAQPASPPGPRGTSEAEKRDTVRLFVVHKMREALALSDAQTLKVLDAMEAVDQERESEKTERRAAFGRLQTLVDNQGTQDPAYKEAVAQFLRFQEQSESKMRELENKLLSIMTPKQQAQYILLRRQLVEELRQDIARPRANRQGRNRQ